jgi:hypothetical protein
MRGQSTSLQTARVDLVLIPACRNMAARCGTADPGRGMDHLGARRFG